MILKKLSSFLKTIFETFCEVRQEQDRQRLRFHNKGIFYSGWE